MSETRPVMNLRDLSIPLRVAATCLLLVIVGGYAASLYFMSHHISQKDGDPELSWVDLVGTYHGVDKPAPMLTALDDPQHGSWLKDAPDGDLQVLRADHLMKVALAYPEFSGIVKVLQERLT